MTDKFLPYGKHTIDDADIAAVSKALQRGMLTGGPEVTALENEFAAYLGVAEAVVVNNGTAALHLACLAAGLGPGDVAIVPAITFLSTANAVRMCGADVIFADINPDTGLMEWDHFETALQSVEGRQLKAVLPVHLNGHMVEMSEISAYCRKHGISIIADCCHALGACYPEGGRPGDGKFEDFGTFSLHPVKSIAMGEGGVITTQDKKKADRMRRLRSHDMTRCPADWSAKDAPADGPWYYEMHELGYNYRAPDILCALGRSQLTKLDDFIVRRREIAALYDQFFTDSNQRLVRPVSYQGQESAWHLYPVLIDFQELELERGRVMKSLAEENIGTQVHYIPVCDQPYYTSLYGRQKIPGARCYYERVLSLPVFPGMMDSDVVKVCNALRHILSF